MIDRIKFDAPTDDVLVWKYPGDEIRIGAQLIVNQSQEALLVKGGKALDLFGPGTHTLSTENIPLAWSIINLPFKDKSVFTAEIWFVNRTVKRDLKWGTRSAIPVLDPVYNYPINVRAYGQWGMRIRDSRSFITQIVGTLQDASMEKIESFFIGEIVQRLSDSLAKFFNETKTSILQANAKLDELAAKTSDAIRAEFDRFGIEIVNFNVERINAPKEELEKLQEVLGKRMEIEQLSGVQAGGGYTTARTFDTLQEAASNPGGSAGDLMAGGLGLGVGLGAAMPMGRQLGQALNMSGSDGAASGGIQDPAARLQKVKGLLDAGLISQAEFDAKRKEILDGI